MMQMSEAAEKALINVGTNRQGAVVSAPMMVQWELENAGIIGRGTGLTRKGTIERERIMNAELDRAFG